MTNDHAPARAGLLLGLGAYLLWGVLPLYFKAIGHVPATEVVAHRIVWSLLFLAALATMWKRWGGIVKAVKNPKVLGTLAVTACLIGANWLIWIWAVLNGHVLEGSLGYYLNPLVNVLLGVILLKEKLSRGQMFAVLLAAAGVAVLAAGAGGALWISLSLAASFALYGFLRKVAPVDSIEGLLVETAILTPVSIAWILYLYGTGQSGLGSDAATNILLILAGAVTAVPLLLFTAAAKRLPYSTLGFLQYIAPSMQFLLAVLVFGERLTLAHIICFGAIWTALAIYAFEGVRTAAPEPGRARRPSVRRLARNLASLHDGRMFNILSIIFGAVALLLALPAFLPLFGWLNWFVIPMALIGLGLGIVSRSKAGRNLNLVVIVVAALRLMLGGGIL